MNAFAHVKMLQHKKTEHFISEFQKNRYPYQNLVVLSPTLTERTDRQVMSGQTIPGLHIIANLSVDSTKYLVDFSAFKAFIEQQIKDLNLTQVGEVYHNFPGGGYTGVVCLTESHLSIHTWPEQNYLTFDVFLSNYLKDNRAVTQALYQSVVNFFQAHVAFEKLIDR